MTQQNKSDSNKKSQLPQGVEKQSSIRIHNPEILQSLAGDLDKNLKIIELELGLKVSRSADEIFVTGVDSEVDLAIDLFQQLGSLIEQGEQLWQGDVQRAIKMLSGNRKLRLEELFRDQVKIAGRKFPILPKTFQQKNYLEAIKSHDIVFGIGPAGTGKTYLAMAMAVAGLASKEFKRVVLCRPAVEAGEKLGFLPGDMAEKVNPYLRPLYDALHDMVEPDKAKEMVERGAIEVAPLAFMRGRTLSNAFVILDEAQNTTPGQMKMLLTRMGHKSKCVITGDPTQVDLPRGTASGLVEAINILRPVNEISFIQFTESDVVRHPLVAKIIAAYEKKDKLQSSGDGR